MSVPDLIIHARRRPSACRYLPPEAPRLSWRCAIHPQRDAVTPGKRSSSTAILKLRQGRVTDIANSFNMLPRAGSPAHVDTAMVVTTPVDVAATRTLPLLCRLVGPLRGDMSCAVPRPRCLLEPWRNGCQKCDCRQPQCGESAVLAPTVDRSSVTNRNDRWEHVVAMCDDRCGR